MNCTTSYRHRSFISWMIRKRSLPNALLPIRSALSWRITPGITGSIEKEENKTGFPPILFSVLSHHRTYRSVYGGFLIYTTDLFVVVREKDEARLFQAFIRYAPTKDRAIGNTPISFPGVRKFPGFRSWDTEFNQVS